MALIALNCPNCSAALRLGAEDRFAKCAFCGTDFLLDSSSRAVKRDTDAADRDVRRGADAAERAASELALRRLHFEQREVERKLSDSEEWHYRRESTKATLSEIERGERHAAAEQSYQTARKVRNVVFLLIPIAAFAVSGNGGVWVTLAVFAAVAIAVQFRAGKAKGAVRVAAQAAASPFVAQPWIPGDDDRKVLARQAQIASEIVRHRRVVESHHA